MLTAIARLVFVLSLFPGLARAQGAAPSDPAAAAMQSLKQKDPMIRRQAANDLARLRDPRATPALLDTLNDKDPFVRAAVVGALGLLRAKEAVPGIGTLLGSDESSEVRQQAAVSLAYFGDPATEAPLIKALGDSDEGVCFAAARSLGALRSVQAAKALGKLLKAPSAGMRRAAAGALGQIATKDSWEDLQGALADQDLLVRRETAKALANIVDSAKPAQGALFKKLLKDPDAEIRIYSAMALGRLGDNSGEQTVIPLLSDQDQTVRQQAANALGLFGSKEAALPALQKSYEAETNPAVKQVFQFALAQLKARIGAKEEPPAEDKKKTRQPVSKKKKKVRPAPPPATPPP